MRSTKTIKIGLCYKLIIKFKFTLCLNQSLKIIFYLCFDICVYLYFCVIYYGTFYNIEMRKSILGNKRSRAGSSKKGSCISFLSGVVKD